MLVGKRMTKNPVTITPDDYLAKAQGKMWEGKFRALPVIKDGRLVGIITDRDLRQHAGYLEKTKVNEAMTEAVVTATPQTTFEEAAAIMLKQKISALPVVEDGKLTGIITTSDILRVFLDVMGVSEEGSVRIDLLLEKEAHDLADASKIISSTGGEILSMGTYREQWGDNPVCYVRLRATDPDLVANALKRKGFTVLGVHV
jgi:acetoin utilization protein AcuB